MLFFSFQPLSENATLREKLSYYKGLSFYSFCLVVHLCAILQAILYGIQHADSLEVLLRNTTDAITVILAVTTGFAPFLRRGDIWKIFVELEAISQNRDKENSVYKVKKYLDGYHQVVITYTGFCCTTFIPHLFPWFSFMISGKMIFLVTLWYPFDVFQPKTFPFALFCLNLYAGLVGVFLSTSNALLYAIITVLSMEFEILRTDIKNLQFESKVERGKKLAMFIERHNKLYELSDKVQDIFEVTFLIRFVISSLIMCIEAFQLSAIEMDLTGYMYNVPYFGMISGQVLLLCWFGQKLIDSSSEVADGFYESDWMDLDDNDYKKQIMLIMLRAQKSQEFTAMKFAKVSIESFTTVRYLIFFSL